MSISATVKALLSLTGKKQTDLQEPLKMGSKQSLSNKITAERWSAEDLIAVAECCGAELLFRLPDGQELPLK